MRPCAARWRWPVRWRSSPSPAPCSRSSPSSPPPRRTRSWIAVRASFQAGERFQQRFGDDAVLILVKGELTRLLLTADLARLVSLEGCISGNLPRGATPPGGRDGPCAAFARERSVQVVYGPGTFLNEAARQIQTEFTSQQTASNQREARAAKAARELAKARGAGPEEQDRVAAEARTLVRATFLRDSLRLALQYGIRSLPTISDPAFVSTVVFDPARGANVPKSRFAYLFPNSDSALVQVRLRPGLSEDERRRAIDLVRDATRIPAFRLANGGTYTVTGAPVLAAGLADSVAAAIVALLIGVVLVMALTLILVFRSRPRLLPLGVALAAAGMLFGAMALAGLSLTVASVAVLPVLVGLAVDYAIQFQSRFDEAVGEGHPAERAAVIAAGRGGPTIATAGLATMAGVLALLLSPVPMVRGFGALLVIGIALAFACALTAGFGTLALARRQGPERPRPAAPRRGRRGLGGSRCARPGRHGHARRRGSAAPPPRRDGPLVRGADRPGLERGAAHLDRAAGPGARRRRGPGRGRVRAGHADQGGLRRAAARPAVAARAARRQRPAALDRGLRGGRRHRAGRRHQRSARGAVDDRLPARAAEALRLLGGARLRRRQAVPGAVAARSLPHPRIHRQPCERPRAARRGAALLLPGGRHARPPRRLAGLRGAADAARGAAAPLRGHALPPGAATRRPRRALRDSRAGRRGQRRGVVAVAPRAHPARRPARRRARPPHRLPARRPRARAAGADRPGDRMVGARACSSPASR